MTRRPRLRRGFTLLELIIAMALAATIALVLYSTLTTAFKARTSVLNQTTSMREAAIALDLIEADLENATPPTAEPTPPAGRVFGPMVGEAGGTGASAAATLSFYTLGRDVQTTSTSATSGANAAAADEDPFLDGARQVVFSIAPDPATGKSVLTRSVQRNVLPTSTAEFEDEPLAGGVTALAFRYFDGSQWLDAWNSDDEENLLPLAIEVTIDLTTTDPRGDDKVYRMARVVQIACGDATALAARGTN